MEAVAVANGKVFFREPLAPLSRRRGISCVWNTQECVLTSAPPSLTLSSFLMEDNSAIRGGRARCILVIFAYVAAVLVPLTAPSLACASRRQTSANASLGTGALAPLPSARQPFARRLANFALLPLVRYRVPAHVSPRGHQAPNRRPNGVFSIKRPENRLPELIQRQRRTNRSGIQTTEWRALILVIRSVENQLVYFSRRVALGLPWSTGPPPDSSFAALSSQTPSLLSACPPAVKAPSKPESTTCMTSCVDGTFVRLTEIASSRKPRVVSSDACNSGPSWRLIPLRCFARSSRWNTGPRRFLRGMGGDNLPCERSL